MIAFETGEPVPLENSAQLIEDEVIDPVKNNAGICRG